MTDPAPAPANPLENLRRPRLLIRAARTGMAQFRRDRDLGRLIGVPCEMSPQKTVPALLDAEARQERIRLAGDAGYSFARHIDLLIALMCEARMLGAP